MKMIEDKQISLESKLSDIVPELTGTLPDYLSVTLSDLLSHRAGIQPYTSSTEYQKLPEFKGSISERRKQFAQFVLNECPIQLKVGNTYSYSNAGYAIAALMMEKISHKTFEELVDITFKRLGLDYFWGFPNKKNVKNPWGHWNNNGDNMIALPPDHDYKLMDCVAPAGDLSMDIIDYSKYIMMNIDGLLGNDNYLKSESYQQIALWVGRLCLWLGKSEIEQWDC